MKETGFFNHENEDTMPVLAFIEVVVTEPSEVINTVFCWVSTNLMF